MEYFHGHRWFYRRISSVIKKYDEIELPYGEELSHNSGLSTYVSVSYLNGNVVLSPPVHLYIPVVTAVMIQVV
jgi:hypothetical protein